jgi:hypothetical protein
MPDNKPSNINSNNNITPKPLEVNKVNPDTGNSDISTSNNINNIQDSFRPPTSLDGKVYTNSYPQGIDAKEYKDRLGPDSTQKSKEYNKAQDLRNIDINNKINNEKSIRYGKNLNTDFLQDLAINKLRGRIESRLKGDPKSDIKPPQQVTPSPVQGASSAVQAKIQEKAKEKMYMLAAKIAAWFSSFFISFMIWLIITVFALAIFAALTMFILDNACGLVQSVGGVGVPEDVKKICEYYVKLKGGCFESAKKEEEKDLTTCIGKDMADTVSTTVELNGVKSKTKVEKKLINEIIKAGKEAGVGPNITRFVIAINPGLSDSNGWEDGQSSTCWGIALLCAKDKDDYYYIATKGLDVKVPQDFVNSPLKQMKAIKVLYDYLLARINAKTIPSCVQDKIKDKKDDVYKVAYIWFNEKCDDFTQRDGLTKARLAELTNNNFIATSCPEFILIINKVAYYENIAYEDRPFKYNSLERNQNTNPLIIKSQAQSSEFIGGNNGECKLIAGVYQPFLIDAANKYQFAPIPMSKYLLGALISRESGSGLTNSPKGCAGRGDGVFGHGLTQFDAMSGGAGPPSSYQRRIEETQKIFTDLKGKAFEKFGKEFFDWTDCKQNINYGASHLIEQLGLYGSKFEKMIQSIGVNTDKNTEGYFKDIKATKIFTQLLFNSNNAGGSASNGAKSQYGYCVIEPSLKQLDGCTANQNYGTEALKRLVDVAKCFGETKTIEEVLAITGGGTSSATACDTNGTSINAQGAEFPLVTKKGSNIKIYYSQPYPEYLGGAGPHKGIDVSPGSNNSNETAVISTFAGTVVAVGNVISTSCNVTCDTKSQRYVILQEDGTGLQTTAIHLNPTLDAPGVGKPVTKGQTIGRIDDFMFVHLHYETRLNGVLQNPITQIKGFNQALQPSNVRAESSIIDPALYEKL